MELNALPKLTDKRLRRVGRGHGTGRGKTSGRGTKGQKARRKTSLFFEGGALPLIKRLPFLRGRGRNPGLKNAPIAINVEKLNSLPSKSKVNIDSLIKNNIAPKTAKRVGVKILGGGTITTALTVTVSVSSGARKKIEKAGGTISPQ